MRTIEIDIDVHKRIEAERRDFNQTENEILRRLLGLGNVASSLSPEVKFPVASKRPWRGRNQKTGKLVELQHGTPLRSNYRNQELTGSIDDGAILVNGKRYAKPSPALIENVSTKAGTKTQLSGWRDWEAFVEGRWISLTNL